MAGLTYPAFPLLFTEGDERPSIDGIVDEAGDLTGYTITFHLERPPPATVLVKTAIAVDLTTGKFRIDWLPGDLVAGYGQLAEIQLLDPSNQALTSEKFVMNVEREIA